MGEIAQEGERVKKRRYLNPSITLQLQALSGKVGDFKKVIDLMKRQSLIAVVYKRLIKGINQKEFYRYTKETHKLPSLYLLCAIKSARTMQKNKKLIFGRRGLFEKLQKQHQKGKRREKLKKEWKERRQDRLINPGSSVKGYEGNPCIGLKDKEGTLYLRITAGKRKYVYARMKREFNNEKDKWFTFLSMLFKSRKTQRRFPYTVELKPEEGKVCGFVSFSYPVSEMKLTRRYGAVAVDTNASALHLYITELSEDGNLISFRRVNLHSFWQYSKGRREYEEWSIAHKILNLTESKSKAIAIKDLRKVIKARRGDKRTKLRNGLHQWNFKNLLRKIEKMIRLKRIKANKVYNAYTSIMDILKHTTLLVIDKYMANMYVIGRRVLGFKKDIQKNYEKLLKDKKFLKFALELYRQKKQRLSEFLEKETNEYTQSVVKEYMSKVQTVTEFIEKELRKEEHKKKSPNLQKEPATSSVPTEETSWRAMKAALLVHVKVFPKDFFSQKRLLISWKWGMERKGSAPFGFGHYTQYRVINWTIPILLCK